VLRLHRLPHPPVHIHLHVPINIHLDSADEQRGPLRAAPQDRDPNLRPPGDPAIRIFRVRIYRRDGFYACARGRRSGRVRDSRVRGQDERLREEVRRVGLCEIGSDWSGFY
jgi:hypothetical protein